MDLEEPQELMQQQQHEKDFEDSDLAAKEVREEAEGRVDRSSNAQWDQFLQAIVDLQKNVEDDKVKELLQHAWNAVDVLVRGRASDLPQKTVVFLGNNGIGKSFIINVLLWLTMVTNAEYLRLNRDGDGKGQPISLKVIKEQFTERYKRETLVAKAPSFTFVPVEEMTDQARLEAEEGEKRLRNAYEESDLSSKKQEGLKHWLLPVAKPVRLDPRLDSRPPRPHLAAGCRVLHREGSED